MSVAPGPRSARRPPPGAAPGAAVAVVVGLLATACAPPRVGPLPGRPEPVALPRGTLPPTHQLVRFRWQYRGASFSANGDGAARVAPPDSVRLDFVAGGVVGRSGHAFLLGDSLVAPEDAKDGGGLRRYLPATPLLWATLGRLAVPPAADTVVRVDADTTWADIGPGAEAAGTTWRVAFAAGQLVSLARLSGGRLRELVVRELDRGRIRYDNPGGRRSLTLTQVRDESVPAFEPGVWHP